MSLKVKVDFPVIDKPKTAELIHSTMSKNVLAACRRWVLAGTNRVPVLTGASKASFIKLAFQVGAALSISPKKKSRIPLGIATSVGELIVERGKRYGWVWESNLDYIHIVDANNDFIAAANASLKDIPELPVPVIKR